MVEGFTLPVVSPYVITQTYREHLEYAAQHPDISYNGGIDLWTEERTIRAAWSGKIEKVAYQAGGYGNYIKIRHDFGFSLYAHLERIFVNVGNQVISGTAIGLMGSTGFSTGMHLHFELRDLQDKVLDPSEYFVQEGVSSGTVRLSAEYGGNLRKTPLGDYICTIPCGKIGKILDGPVYKNGLACFEVEFPVRGWMAARDNFGTIILEEYGD